MNPHYGVAKLPASARPYLEARMLRDDDDIDDHDGYIYFMGKARLEKAINSLYGLVQGISADGEVNRAELAELTRWVSRHREYVNLHPFSEVIPVLQAVVADGIVDEEEIADLLWLTKRLAKEDAYWDDVTADMQELHGLLHGMLADSRITEQELSQLSTWIDSKCHLRSCWPYDELESIISMIMKDGVIDDQEHEALMQFFGEFTGTTGRKAIGATDRNCTVSGVCAYAPEIVIEGRMFCFTGASEKANRDGLAGIVESRGGQFHKNLRNDTHYLIVGAKGNPCWAYACYGRKVEDAVERRRSGQRLLIVHEHDFWDHASD
jgi:hypothetical protein